MLKGKFNYNDMVLRKSKVSFNNNNGLKIIKSVIIGRWNYIHTKEKLTVILDKKHEEMTIIPYEDWKVRFRKVKILTGKKFEW